MRFESRMSPELGQLIEEQRRDELLGDRVRSLSLNQETETDDSWMDNLAVYDGVVYLFNRPIDRGRRRNGLLGYRARRSMSHRYWHVCQDCGRRCSTEAQRCPPCDHLKQSEVASEVREHNYTTYRRYGCRCDICKASMREHNRKQVQRGPASHGVSGYSNYGCRCHVCSSAYTEYRAAKRAA